MANFFNRDLAEKYDVRNKKLALISDNMHFLIRLILKDLPKKARILCVGVGTGAEIFSLSTKYPEWSFVGVDPSADMLSVCQERLDKAGIGERCQLIHGYIQDIAETEVFDGVLTILVGHFIKIEERFEFYKNMEKRLKSGGYLVNTEISFDLNSKEFPQMLENWKQIQSLMGATAESLEALPRMMREALTILPPLEVEKLISDSGIMPIRFFQSFMIHGWYGRKEL